MIKLDRLCAWVFIFTLAMLPLHNFFGYADEISYGALLAIALADCIINRNWRRYYQVGIVILILAFYAVYSVVAVHYTVPKAILKDFVIELKPYATFFVMLAIAPKFNEAEKFIIKIICIVSVVLGFAVLLGGRVWVELIMEHLSYICQGAAICGLVYLYVSRQKDGSEPVFALVTTIAFLITGIPAAKAKYLGFMVLAVFFIFFYKPGMFRHASPRTLVIIGVLMVGVVGISWNKIHYYFLQEPTSMVDLNNEESYARPALYAGSLVIFQDHFPFGSGLASFASFASIEPYSGVYEETGLDKVWGLSESYPNFICDAFYPSLAQFGIAGVVLFILFWVYVFRLLRNMLRKDPEKYNIPYVVGVLIVYFLLIESIAATTFTNAYGQAALMLLGMICAGGVKKKETTEKYLI